MSRYYNILLSPAGGGDQLYQWASTDTGLVSGRWQPGSLQVDMDLVVGPYRRPIQNARVSIKGIQLRDISQAADMAGMQVQVYGGMGAGLPLAKPSQAGLLTSGYVFQAFANWVGTDMSLNLMLRPLSGDTGTPANLSLAWHPGQTLGDAIGSALNTAFPLYKPAQVNTSPTLVNFATTDTVGTYGSVEKMASGVKDLSVSMMHDDSYRGIDIIFVNNQWVVYDSTAASATAGGSTKDNPKLIDFMDLIGQPTWYDPGSISFSCPMRSDLGIGDFVKLPPGPVTTLAPSAPQARSKTAFSGVFGIGFIRHTGSYRQADAGAWITTCFAYVTDPSAWKSGQAPQET